MTRKEIERRIRQEKLRIVIAEAKIEEKKSEIRATRKAIRFWEGELKKAKSREGGKEWK